MNLRTTEQKIEAWKESLLEAGAFSEEQLYELEDHLRLKLDDLLASGQNPERAFAEATVAIGHPVALGQSYSENNSRLIIRQLILYFFIGFPVFAAIGQIFDLSINLTSLFLLELGWRGIALSIGSFIPWTILGILLLWQTIKDPFWLTSLPRKIAQQKNRVIASILVLFLGIVALAHTFYFEWIFDNNELAPKDYLLYNVSAIPTYISMAAIWALKAIGIFLFFSVSLNAIQKNSRPEHLWRRLSLLSMIGGFFFMVNLIQYSLNLFGFVGSYTEMMQQLQTHVFSWMAILSIITVIFFRYFHKKGKLFVQA